MNRNIQNTFLSNNPVVHKGEKFLVLETCKNHVEMLILKLTDDGKPTKIRKAYHYFQGVMTPIDLATARTNGVYFNGGVIHNWITSIT